MELKPIYEDENRPTSLKKRYKNASKTLIRINQLQDLSVNIKLQDKILNNFKN